MLQNLNFNLFGDYKDFEATPERISQLLSEMLKIGLNVMPGTFQQVNPGLGMQKFDRMQFIDQKNNFTIMFNVDSIHITQTMLNDKSYNLKRNINKFISDINKILLAINKLEQEVPLGRRISLVVSTLNNDSKIKSLDDIYKDFSNTIPFYEPEETFEWNARAVRRENHEILEYKEKFNIVSEVTRTQGELDKFGEKEYFDTINTTIDVNTLNENTKERIDSVFSKEFLEKAATTFSSQYEAIEVKLK